jgi:hypothetical protein
MTIVEDSASVGVTVSGFKKKKCFRSSVQGYFQFMQRINVK